MPLGTNSAQQVKCRRQAAEIITPGAEFTSTVTLNGHVHSWQQRDDASLAAWAAPGVMTVENRLSVQ
jgi:hypothetical protein